MTAPLGAALTAHVLAYLGVEPLPPTIHALKRLVGAYTRRVPWESVSRIVRRALIDLTEDCPRWPETFWGEALSTHTGGTCFESNYAFFSLLRALGYDGYLTLNNMGDAAACHSAIVIDLAGQRYLVDVGLPLHAPIPIHSGVISTQPAAFHTYRLLPEAADRYQVERDRHPRPNCFTFIDNPVDDAVYRHHLMLDYGIDGLFLDRVIITRVIEERIWRFNAEQGAPYHLEAFAGESKTYYGLGDHLDATAAAVAAKFALPVDLIYTALTLTAPY